MTLAMDHIVTKGHAEDCPARSVSLSHRYYQTTDNAGGRRVYVDYCNDCDRDVACEDTCKQRVSEQTAVEASLAREAEARAAGVAHRKHVDNVLRGAQWAAAAAFVLSIILLIIF